MSKIALCVVAVSALILSVVTDAPAAMIAFRPTLIPVGKPPVPVPLAIDPAAPTTTDMITFTAPLDGEVHSSECHAAAALEGHPVLTIDEAKHTIHISFDGIYSDICPEIYEPVSGAYGEFGLLAAGKWIFYNSNDDPLEFTVLPEPASLLLLSAGAAGLLTHRRRKT